eukprot:scaffold67855_cov35-Attheya_sp.AAC.3
MGLDLRNSPHAHDNERTHGYGTDHNGHISHQIQSSIIDIGQENGCSGQQDKSKEPMNLLAGIDSCIGRVVGIIVVNGGE